MKPALEIDELRAALSGAMVEMRYQPIVSIRDRAPVGFEALARLNHPDLGMMRPARFVPQIEKAGLAGLLAGRVISAVLADLSGEELRPHGLRAGINLPLEVLLVPDATTRLDEMRRRHDIAAECVIIELTESQPVLDLPPVRRAIEQLRRLGYRVAIDDVGPSTPGLEGLLELPFNTLKFDKRPVRMAERNPADHDFVARMAALASARGWMTVAEGVIGTAGWGLMAELGVDAAQGYWIAPPLCPHEVPNWLSGWHLSGTARPQSYANGRVVGQRRVKAGR